MSLILKSGDGFIEEGVNTNIILQLAPAVFLTVSAPFPQMTLRAIKSSAFPLTRNRLGIRPITITQSGCCNSREHPGQGLKNRLSRTMPACIVNLMTP